MVSVACSKIKKHGKSMESMEYHHGYKIENHGNTMVLPWYHSKSTNQNFSFHNNIYTVFLPLSYNKMVLINKTLLNICKFLNKYMIVLTQQTHGPMLLQRRS